MATRAHKTTTQRSVSAGKRPPRRKASSIRDESAYIAETKRRLRNPEALLANLAREPLPPDDETSRAMLLQFLTLYEQVLPLSRFVRDLRPLLERNGDDAEDVLNLVRNTIHSVLAPTESERFTTLIEAPIIQHVTLLRRAEAYLVSTFSNWRDLNLLEPQLLDRFRMQATLFLRGRGYSDRQIAELVDEGEVDRTRKRRPSPEAIKEMFGPLGLQGLLLESVGSV
jgi:hypothetical protein